MDLGDALNAVRAPEAGRVVIAQTTRTPGQIERGEGRPRPWDGYGPALVVMHGDSGWWHLLGHLDAPLALHPGDRVTEGQLVGSTRALGHVHRETRARLRPPAGHAVVEVTADPFSVLDGAPRMWSPAMAVPDAPEQSARTPAPLRPEPGPMLDVEPPGPRPTMPRQA